MSIGLPTLREVARKIILEYKTLDQALAEGLNLDWHSLTFREKQSLSLRMMRIQKTSNWQKAIEFVKMNQPQVNKEELERLWAINLSKAMADPKTSPKELSLIIDKVSKVFEKQGIELAPVVNIFTEQSNPQNG